MVVFDGKLVGKYTIVPWIPWVFKTSLMGEKMEVLGEFYWRAEHFHGVNVIPTLSPIFSEKKHVSLRIPKDPPMEG